ncbi:MAG: hypothetical protein ACTS3R_00235 [Inquilinaceae bacterium]
MTGFDADWLSLREPFDADARDPVITQAWRDARPRHGALSVVDLGAGTGSNFRFLAPRLGPRQDWLMIDRDPALLTVLERNNRLWAGQMGLAIRSENPLHLSGVAGDLMLRAMRLDLATQFLELNLAGVHLVTGSALLDLVSAAWIDMLTGRCRDAGAALCFALTYDGRVAWQPTLEADALVLALFNRHQRSDKGFGPALGPSAAERAADRLGALGYRVTRSRSDWRLPATAQSMQRQVLAGFAAAAEDMAPERSDLITDWTAARRAAIDSGTSTLQVGHTDLFASLPS